MRGNNEFISSLKHDLNSLYFLHKCLQTYLLAFDLKLALYLDIIC